MKGNIFSIAVTGHRPKKLYGYNLYDPRWIQLAKIMRRYLLRKEREKGCLECVSGMALGVDQLFALVALKLRDDGHAVKVLCALPCRDQNKAWKDDLWWRDIMRRADERFFVHDGLYTRSCMTDRNKWMADRADEILAVWDGSCGGTGHCVKYALEKNVPVINIFGGIEVELKQAGERYGKFRDETQDCPREKGEAHARAGRISGNFRPPSL